MQVSLEFVRLCIPETHLAEQIFVDSTDGVAEGQEVTHIKLPVSWTKLLPAAQAEVQVKTLLTLFEYGQDWMQVEPFL